MKPLLTFLLTCMISVSLMGQHDIHEMKVQKKQFFAIKQQNCFSTLEQRMMRNPDDAPRHSPVQLRKIQVPPLKADLATDQQMDSILWEAYDTVNKIWVLTDRELFTYDENGNMINYVWFAFDSVDMKILPSEREMVKYNAHGQPIEIIQQTWNKASGQWVNSIKFELFYDGEGNLIQEKVYDWDPVSEWLIGAVFDMTYDGEGNLLEELWSFWDEDSSKLLPTFKDEYIYDGGKLTLMNEYYWEEGAWELTFRTTYTYDGDNLVEELTEGWDYFSEEWADYSLYIYTYNEADKLVLEEFWDFDWQQFMMVRKALYEYTWDADGNLTEEVDKSWDEGSGTWQNEWRSVWTVNKDYTIFDLYVPYWFMGSVEELQFVNMPVSELGYIYVNGQWVENYKQTAYYSEFGGGGPSDIEDVHETPLSVFPNPAAGSLTFKWDEKYERLYLELYDLAGRRLMNRSIEPNMPISVDNLSRGMYIYKLMDDNNLIYSGKISLK